MDEAKKGTQEIEKSKTEYTTMRPKVKKVLKLTEIERGVNVNGKKKK